jgi:hypothetical protein
MKVYIACPWVSRSTAKIWATIVEERGHTITRKWWEHEAGSEDFDILREQAVADLDAVGEADAVLLLQAGKSEGKAVETGAALMLGVPVVVVLWDQPGNIFHRHPGVLMVDDLPEALGALDAIEAFAL